MGKLDRTTYMRMRLDGVSVSLQSPRNPAVTFQGGAFIGAASLMGAVLVVYTLLRHQPRVTTLLGVASLGVVPLLAYVAWLWVWPTLGREVLVASPAGLRVDCRLGGLTLKRVAVPVDEIVDLRVEHVRQAKLAVVLSGPPAADARIVFGHGESLRAVGAGVTEEDAPYVLDLLVRALSGKPILALSGAA